MVVRLLSAACVLLMVATGCKKLDTASTKEIDFGEAGDSDNGGSLGDCKGLGEGVRTEITRLYDLMGVPRTDKDSLAAAVGASLFYAATNASPLKQVTNDGENLSIELGLERYQQFLSNKDFYGTNADKLAKQLGAALDKKSLAEKRAEMVEAASQNGTTLAMGFQDQALDVAEAGKVPQDAYDALDYYLGNFVASVSGGGQPSALNHLAGANKLINAEIGRDAKAGGILAATFASVVSRFAASARAADQRGFAAKLEAAAAEALGANPSKLSESPELYYSKVQGALMARIVAEQSGNKPMVEALDAEINELLNNKSLIPASLATAVANTKANLKKSYGTAFRTWQGSAQRPGQTTWSARLARSAANSARKAGR